MSDRSKVPGYVRQRGKTWQVIVELPPDPLTGRRRRIFRTAKTETAAQRLRARLVTEATDGHAQGPERRTVAELMTAWLAHVEANRSPLTMKSYRSKIDTYVIPNLGKVRLDRLKTVQLDGLYVTLRASGGEGGAELSAQTVKHVHAILHAALTQARRWGWIVRNPAEDATPPVVDSAEPTPPTPEEVLALLEGARAAKDPVLELGIWLGAMVGARRGELCGLRWSDVVGSVLTIERSIVVVGGGELRAKPPKTRKVRRATLGPVTVRLLSAHRALCDAQAALCDTELAPMAYVLSEAPDGAEPFSPDVLSKRFGRLAERHGVKCHFHLLRHYHDTQALAGGVDIGTIAGRAGHDRRMVLERYGHLLATADAKAAKTLEATLRPKPARR